MRARLIQRALICLVLAMTAGPAEAQVVIEDHEVLDRERPEAWAMNFLAASTYATGSTADAGLAPGRWQLELHLAQIPHLDERQRTVGFSGTKAEDLNKAPVSGRLQFRIGLPGNLVAELGFTPPVSVNGVRPSGLVAAALGRPIVEHGPWRIVGRVFGQTGSVQGDITCPAGLAGSADPAINAYACQAPSRDRMTLNAYGLDVAGGVQHGPWHAHADLGVVRSELAVRLDALTSGFRDRSYLTATSVRPYLAIGLDRDLSARWRGGVELMCLPLKVSRVPGNTTRDDFVGLRLHLVYNNNRN